MDHFERHALSCKRGNGPTWRHDETNEFIGDNIIKEWTIDLVIEPTKLDGTNRIRQAIIIKDDIIEIDEKMVPNFMDMMLTDVYNQESLRQLALNQFGIFNAGKAFICI